MKASALDKKTETIIGFAIKSRQVAKGFEAVRRAIDKKKLSVIIIDNDLSVKTYNKLNNKIRNENIPLIRTPGQMDWKKTWGIDSKKILGILKGEIGNKLLHKFNAGA
jgi:ribosomal protein L7Ae-like RNA K-turn-binding protein